MRLVNVCLLGVVAMGLAGCQEQVNPRVVARLNQDAALVGDLPSNPLGNKVITSWISKKDATMSTLYGNDVAVEAARSSSDVKYPAGSVLSAVTWEQQEDPRWFGGKIPKAPKSVEFVTVGAGAGAYTYQRYEGSPLKRVEEAAQDDRAVYLMSQRAAVMP
jgi:hypothetical protein